MADFEVTDAALSGLRLIARKPKILPWWIGFNLIAMGAYVALLFLLFGNTFRQFVDLIAKAAAQKDIEPLGSEFGKLALQMIPTVALAVLILLPLLLLYTAMKRNAAARAMLTPDDDRFGYLRLGADEFRSMVVILALGIIRFVVQVLFTAGITALAMVAVGAQRTAGNAIGAQFLQQVLQLPMYAILVFLFLKFAFAIPHTLQTQRISIFESWSMTNGHLVKMLLSYLIVFVIAIVASIAIGLIGFIFLGAAGGGRLMQIIPLFETDTPGALTQLFALLPALIVAIAVLSAIFTPIITALYYCPAAYIYARVTGRAEDVFE